MKPCNFPGRRHARRTLAAERRQDYVPATRTKGARAQAHPTVKDTRCRIGAANRDPETGVARG